VSGGKIGEPEGRLGKGNKGPDFIGETASTLRRIIGRTTFYPKGGEKLYRRKKKIVRGFKKEGRGWQRGRGAKKNWSTAETWSRLYTQVLLAMGVRKIARKVVLIGKECQKKGGMPCSSQSPVSLGGPYFLSGMSSECDWGEWGKGKGGNGRGEGKEETDVPQ